MVSALLAALVLLVSIAGCDGGEEDTAGSTPPRSAEAAPGVPSGKGGDDSIQTWGVEASSSERTEATTVVQAYLDARVDRNWERVCAHLAVKARAGLSRLFGGVDCAAAMKSFSARAGTRTLTEEADIQVLSFRVGGGYAFLIYRRSDGFYATTLTSEGGAWRLISITPSPIS